MASNILLEASTALSKSTIFSALRQDLIRRLLNTRREIDWTERINVINRYTEMLANSGHKFAFTKSIVLQAVTKYEWMVERSKLDPENKLFLPLYRERIYNQPERKIIKYIAPTMWYTGENIKDPYRHQWKARIKRRHNRNKTKMAGILARHRFEKRRNTREIETTTTIFIPSTEGSLLFKIIEGEEERISTNSSWTVKLLERSGKPLVNLLMSSFKITQGCPEKGTCFTCKNGDGVACSNKNLVYLASCITCGKGAKMTESADRAYDNMNEIVDTNPKRDD